MSDDGLLLYGVLVEMPDKPNWTPEWLCDDIDTDDGTQRRPAVYARWQEAERRAEYMASHFGPAYRYRIVSMRAVAVLQGDQE